MASKIKIMITTKLEDDLIDDLTKYGQHMCKYIASSAGEMLAKRFSKIINEFYTEYTPGDASEHQFDDFYNHFPYDLYVRHHDRGLGLKPGLGFTFTKYYRNPHNTIYRGGIIITNEKMYTDYHARDNGVVLQSFLDGYHGPEFMGIHKGLFPLREILEYRDDLKANIDKYFGAAANSYAATFSYKFLRT